MEKAILIICGKEYELRFTIGFWKRIKEECGIDVKNIEQRLQEDFGVIAPKIILQGITGDKPTLEQIESSLDRSVLDVFEQAIINGMTKAEKEMLELAKKQRASAIEKISQGESEGKK